jgi:hypothetical protein
VAGTEEVGCDKQLPGERTVEGRIHIDFDMSRRYTVKSVNCWKRGPTRIEANCVVAFGSAENLGDSAIEQF